MTPRTSPRSRRRRNFNPHSPCGERRQGIPSILPSLYFNPHSPCGERHARTRRHRDILCYFNPHSPCGERLHPLTHGRFDPEFQSTLPLRGAIGLAAENAESAVISIHTPLAGSDNWWFRAFRPSRNFNPHSPCGERPGLRNPTKPLSAYFNPHSPCGERRWTVPSSVDSVLFQSTLPLRGATWMSARRTCTGTNFNPHSPCGERRTERPQGIRYGRISIHTPLAGSDARCR